MALLNRQLTDAEIRTLTAAPRRPIDANWLWNFIKGPHYQFVLYRAGFDRVDYERSDTFYGLGPVSPSDSVWMVPHGLEALETSAW